MQKWTKTLIVGTVGILVLGILATVALAQSDGQDTPAPPELGRQDRGKLDADRDSYLAAALGISEDELAAAQVEARIAGIDAMLDAGLITQQQAERLREQAEADDLGPRGFDFGRGHFDRGLGDLIDPQALLADALGITVDELEAAQDEAFSSMLTDAVAEGLLTQEEADLKLAMRALKDTVEPDAILADALGISVEELTAAREDGTLRDLMAEQDPLELRAALVAGYEAAVNQAAADGLITQAQADEILGMPFPFFGRGHGGGHHRGGGPRGGFGGGAGEFGPGALGTAFDA